MSLHLCTDAYIGVQRNMIYNIIGSYSSHSVENLSRPLSWAKVHIKPICTLIWLSRGSTAYFTADNFLPGAIQPVLYIYIYLQTIRKYDMTTTMGSLCSRNLKRQYIVTCIQCMCMYIYISQPVCAFRIPDDLRWHPKDTIFRGLWILRVRIYISIRIIYAHVDDEYIAQPSSSPSQ